MVVKKALGPACTQLLFYYKNLYFKRMHIVYVRHVLFFSNYIYKFDFLNSKEIFLELFGQMTYNNTI